MTQVRTTFRPDQVLDVEDDEFAYLERAGLLYGSAATLYVNFFSYSDGPPATVTQVKIRIQGPSPATTDVVALTASGINDLGSGAFAYEWGANVTAGTYLVTWTAKDVDNVTVTATENVTVSA